MNLVQNNSALAGERLFDTQYLGLAQSEGCLIPQKGASCAGVNTSSKICSLHAGRLNYFGYPQEKAHLSRIGSHSEPKYTRLAEKRKFFQPLSWDHSPLLVVNRLTAGVSKMTHKQVNLSLHWTGKSIRWDVGKDSYFASTGFVLEVLQRKRQSVPLVDQATIEANIKEREQLALSAKPKDLRLEQNMDAVVV